MSGDKTICWVDADRCAGCAAWEGKAPHCAYRPPTMFGRLIYWFKGRCTFRNIFIGRAETLQVSTPPQGQPHD